MSQAQSPALPPHTHLTPQEIAVSLRVTVGTVYRLCEDRELPFLRWGHVIRIPRAQSLRWYEQRGTCPRVAIFLTDSC
jgi:excisionase family DNA binding protein